VTKIGQSESGGLIRLQREGRLLPAGSYSDLVVREDLGWYVVSVAGLAAYDPTTGRVVGYEPHSGEYASNALEQQIKDIFAQLDRLLSLLAKSLDRRYVDRQIETEAGPYDISLANLCRVSFYLRGEEPKSFARADDAYRAEFARRGAGAYPARITTMGHRFPAEAALVEMDFELAVRKTTDEVKRTLAEWGIHA
jgi:enamine deaminase RidA (YjgF/YER057c/UK114 family)